MTACILILAIVVVCWAVFIACVWALFMGSSAPTPKPPLTKEQTIWLVAMSKVASRKRSA